LSPDPNTTAPITSNFILNGLGPNGTAKTLVDDIDSGLSLTQNVQKIINLVINSCVRFGSSR
jgi:hypothetical protein